MNFNTSYTFFQQIQNIDIPQTKPKLLDAFTLTNTKNNDMYIVYMDIYRKIGVHNLNSNNENKELDCILLVLSLLLTNREYLDFKQIKEIFKTYIIQYILYNCNFSDLKNYIDNDKY